MPAVFITMHAYIRAILIVLLSSEVIEADVCVIDAQRVEQVKDGLCHHRRTAALALRLSTIRDHVAHMNFRLTLRFPHKLKFAGTPLKGYLCDLSHEKPIHGLLHSNVNNSSHPKYMGTSRVNKNRGTHGSPSILI